MVRNRNQDVMRRNIQVGALPHLLFHILKMSATGNIGNKPHRNRIAHAPIILQRAGAPAAPPK